MTGSILPCKNQKAVSAFFTSNQILHFLFAEHTAHVGETLASVWPTCVVQFCCTKQKAASAYFTSEQMLRFGFVRQRYYHGATCRVATRRGWPELLGWRGLFEWQSAECVVEEKFTQTRTCKRTLDRQTAHAPLRQDNVSGSALLRQSPDVRWCRK